MSWAVVVLFATMAGDIYIFTEPTFETRDECMAALYDTNSRNNMLKKLVMEYGRPMPIRGVNCIDTDTLNNLMEQYKVQIMPQTEKEI